MWHFKIASLESRVFLLSCLVSPIPTLDNWMSEFNILLVLDYDQDHYLAILSSKF